jgi:hypothetical protein
MYANRLDIFFQHENEFNIFFPLLETTLPAKLYSVFSEFVHSSVLFGGKWILITVIFFLFDTREPVKKTVLHE